MTTDSNLGVSPAYALGRLLRAIHAAEQHPDPEIRKRARAKIEKWTHVIEGMAKGTLTVGSRTPVADTPAWVTLEVAHGGFATGRFLAEGELREHEVELLGELSADVPGETPRERLNLFYLGDAGQARLRAALRDGRYDIEVPEEAALMVVAWLSSRAQTELALDLVCELRPLMHRLRFYPRLTDRARGSSTNIHVSTVGAVAEQLSRLRPSSSVTTMNATLGVWNPLYDELVRLWLGTVVGDPPTLARDDQGRLRRGEDGQPLAVGGWPGRRWPGSWTTDRDHWLASYRAALHEHGPSGRHHARGSNFQILLRLLESCPSDAAAVSERDVAVARHALACAISRHGAPGEAALQQLRVEQARVASLPLHAEIAAVVASRLKEHPPNEGLASLDVVKGPVREGESPRVPPGSPIPSHFVTKAERALLAPVDVLVERGIVGSAEVLAIVLPQITSQIAAAGITDADLRMLFTQTYVAFRRRRSLLLLDLAHQVRLEELPWVATLASFRRDDLSTATLAHATLREVTLLTLDAFPHTIVPNPLVREMATLSERAGLKLPFVEEVAADIFMGTFTKKFGDAAELASALLAGTLYARYYDLPSAPASRPRRFLERWRKRTDDTFARLCRERAAEAGTGGGHVARNGAILEQSQISTTFNLATLVHGLDLQTELAGRGHELATKVFDWIVDRHRRMPKDFLPRLRVIKNTAYAWRQALFFLSFAPEDHQRRALAHLQARLTTSDEASKARLAPVAAGLSLILDGRTFDATGVGPRGERRFLGWSCGRHFMMPAPRTSD